MKKKPLHLKELAHGKSAENDQANWISAVATLINTDIVASGEFHIINYGFCWLLTHSNAIYSYFFLRILRWNDSSMEIGR